MKTCPICGAKVIEITEGSSLEIRCTKCNYSVATSNINLIYEDETIYSIILETGNVVNSKVITVLKGILKLPTSEVIGIVKNDCPFELFLGNAVSIKEEKEKLKNANIKFHIIPEYIW